MSFVDHRQRWSVVRPSMDFAVTGHITPFWRHETTTKTTHMVSKKGRVFCFLPTSCTSNLKSALVIITDDRFSLSMVKNETCRQIRGQFYHFFVSTWGQNLWDVRRQVSKLDDKMIKCTIKKEEIDPQDYAAFWYIRFYNTCIYSLIQYFESNFCVQSYSL